MSLFTVPICPNCGSNTSRVLRTAANIARLACAALAGLAIGDVIPVQWRCDACGEVFAAVGARSVGNRRTPGFPIAPSAASDQRNQRPLENRRP